MLLPMRFSLLKHVFLAADDGGINAPSIELSLSLACRLQAILRTVFITFVASAFGAVLAAAVDENAFASVSSVMLPLITTVDGSVVGIKSFNKVFNHTSSAAHWCCK